MFYSPKLYLRDWWVTAPLGLVAGIQSYIWWYLIVNVRPSDEQFFLHYNIILGVDLVGEWWRVFYWPIGGLIIFLVNYLFSYFAYGTDKFLSRILGMTALLAHVFIFIAVALVVQLNS